MRNNSSTRIRRAAAVVSTLALAAGSLLLAAPAQAADPALLGSLTFSVGTLSPAFNESTFEYGLAVADEPTRAVTETTFSVTADPTYSISYKLNGAGPDIPIDSGVSSDPIEVSAIGTVVSVTVVNPLAGPPPVFSTYNVTLTRGAPWDAQFLEQCAATGTTYPCIDSISLKDNTNSLVDPADRRLAVRLTVDAATGATIIWAGVNDSANFMNGLSRIIATDESLKVTVNMGPTADATPGYFVYTTGGPGQYASDDATGDRLVSWEASPKDTSYASGCSVTDCSSPGATVDLVAMMTVLVPADNLSVPTQFAGGYLASNAQDIALGSPAGKFEFKAAGPHFRQDGTTLNTADFYIMLPRIAVQEVLGIPDPSANASLYDVARDGGAPISDVLFAINVMTGEITAYYPGFGFSTPTFVWKAASTDNGGGGGDNGGSGGSGGSSGSTDTTPTLATPVPLPAPPVLGPVPVVPDPPANPAVVTPVAPGVKLLAAAAAANVAPRLMLNYPTVRMGKAPHVPAMTSHPVALVAQGMNPNAMFTVKIKVNGVYSVLGRVRADAKGMLALPVFTVSRPGVYTIALVNEANGSVRYLKVDVTRGQG